MLTSKAENLLQTLTGKNSYILPLLVFLFYLPYVPRYFMGDDFLWLYHADLLISQPTHLLDRPIYGYFRPLYLLYIFVCHNLMGMNALVMGLLNLSLHCLNIRLLMRLLLKLEATPAVAVATAGFFGFYFLNCSAVCWISSGADIITLGLLLLFTSKLIDYYTGPTPGKLYLIILFGLLAAITKETGLVALPLFFAFPIITGKNPFSKKFLKGSLVVLSVYTAFLIFYFMGRELVDKAIEPSADSLINLWYLYIYTALPLSKRIVQMAGTGLEPILTALKAIATFLLPLSALYLFVKRPNGQRFMLIWPLILLAPIALFNWELNLFSVYPERTASRFMYAATPGISFLIGVLLVWLLHHFLKSRIWVIFFTVAIMIFNSTAIYLVTRLYSNHQLTAQSLVEGFKSVSDRISGCDKITILIEDQKVTSGAFENPKIIEAMVQFATGYDVEVSVLPASDSLDPAVCQLYWSDANQIFTDQKLIHH